MRINLPSHSRGEDIIVDFYKIMCDLDGVENLKKLMP
jgi:hypothetical protein